MKSLVFMSLAMISVGLPVGSAQADPGGLYSAETRQPVVLDEVLMKLKPGSVVILGENHGFKTHQTQHMVTLSTLAYLGFKVSVGLEFFYYPDQDAVDSWRAGNLSEEDFLATINWSSPSFDYYRDQALFPNLANGERTVALNAPRWLTSKVGKTGLQSLTPDEAKWLPPNFQLGRDSYRTRFEESVPHVMPPEVMDRYFAAQSIWDDTMAWRAKEFLDQHPEQILVIIVGEFHVQYGGGLPDRLRARGVNSVVTFSQINTKGMADTEIGDILEPSARDGKRADYLWLAPAE